MEYSTAPFIVHDVWWMFAFIISLLVSVFAGAIVFSLIILAVKMAPAYIEYASVKKLMYKIGHEPNFATMSNEEIAKAFDEGANLSYISSVKSSDLTISAFFIEAKLGSWPI